MTGRAEMINSIARELGGGRSARNQAIEMINSAGSVDWFSVEIDWRIIKPAAKICGSWAVAKAALFDAQDQLRHRLRETP